MEPPKEAFQMFGGFFFSDLVLMALFLRLNEAILRLVWGIRPPPLPRVSAFFQLILGVPYGAYAARIFLDYYGVLGLEECPMDVLTGANLGLHLLLGCLVLAVGSAIFNVTVWAFMTLDQFKHECLIESWPEVGDAAELP